MRTPIVIDGRRVFEPEGVTGVCVQRGGVGVKGTFDEEKAKRKGFYYKRS